MRRMLTQSRVLHRPTRHSAGKPIIAGWAFSWLAALELTTNSWTAPLDVVRLLPGANINAAAATQILHLLPRLPDTSGRLPLFVFDGGYDPVRLALALEATPAQLLVRIRSDRCFYADPPPAEVGTLGRPRRHGAKFACTDPATWPPPSAALTTTDAQYGTVTVHAWSGLHAKTQQHGSRGPRPGSVGQTRPHVDELTLTAPASVEIGKPGHVLATLSQAGRTVPVAYAKDLADWSGSPNLHIGSRAGAKPRHVAVLDPVTGTLTALCPGQVVVAVTVNGVTRQSTVALSALGGLTRITGEPLAVRPGCPARGRNCRLAWNFGHCQDIFRPTLCHHRHVCDFLDSRVITAGRTVYRSPAPGESVRPFGGKDLA